MAENNYLYGLTVQGIQSYIFATNKLKEIIGASEIIEQICTNWFNDFLTKKEKGKSKFLLNAAGNIRFQTDEATAKRIFTEYHYYLFKNAPGVPFSQAVVEIKENNDIVALEELDGILRAERNKAINSPSLGCMVRSKHRRTGNFSSENFDKNEKEFFDEITQKKVDKSGGETLTNKIELEKGKYTFPLEFSEIAFGGKDSWLALVHIDGNGMGDFIKTFFKNSDIKGLSQFSKDIDECTRNAFNTAIQKVFIESEKVEYFKTVDDKVILPFRPIVLGGDDVTLIMRADFALDFTESYLSNFEDNTKNSKINPENGLTACAGIAYIKEKFPFHYSARLVEELCKYAKDKSARKYSCLQFHKVQDSIFEDYVDIQERELTANGFDFITKPYGLKEIENTTAINSIKDFVTSLKEDGSPKNKIREWVDSCFNNPLMADEMLDRIPKNKSFNKKDSINYLTLLAIENNENRN